jgi:hypothetical protein
MAETVGNVALGAGQMLIPGEQSKEVHAEEAWDALKNRYGSWDAFKRTLERDPVGVAADVTGAGAVIRPTRVLDRALSPTGREESYLRASKFPTTLGTQKRRELARTALDERLMPTSGGALKLSDTVNELNKRIDELVTQADVSGAQIPVDVLTRHLQELKTKYDRPTLERAEDLATLQELEDAMLQISAREGRDWLSPAEVQNFKTRTYEKAYEKRRQQDITDVETEGRQALARAAKEELEVLSPELKDVNARWGQLAELQPHLERAAGRVENRDPLGGINVPTSIAGGGVAAGDIGAALGATKSILEFPKMQAYKALLLDALRKRSAEDRYFNRPGLRGQVPYRAGQLSEDEEAVDGP